MFKINLRNIELNDLESYRFLNHPSREFYKFNGPYFGTITEKELDKGILKLKDRLLSGELGFPTKKLIVDAVTNELIGSVNKYYKSKETNWMEIGIVIFNEHYWGRGIGYSALKLWTTTVFKEHPEIIRLGLTTWSGNVRMMKLAEKLDFKKEAVYRKARIVDNEYYDSVSYGILREEWENINEKA